MTKFVVGIDLALNVSGVSIFGVGNNGSIVPLNQFIVDTSKIKDIHNKAMYMKSKIMENVYKELKSVQTPIQLDICVEIGLYRNHDTTSSFSRMLGNLECWFKLSSPKALFNKVNVWQITPNDWFEKFNKEFGLTDKHINQLTRQQRKEFSINKANEVFKLETKSNDISDSVWIAYYAI